MVDRKVEARFTTLYRENYRRRPGRPGTRRPVKTLIVRMARENPAWIKPAPRRAGPTWRQFLAAQAQAIIACDFLVVETVLLKRLYVLVFIEHGTRGLHSNTSSANACRCERSAHGNPRSGTSSS
ncbi:hypothetical protein [Rhizohabitans arisaemae]|uniref:hypothetical protein n=1 Tax=Rhizohabitans arisaemae TaxID=2720610 RepID=UPI0024B12E9A|nr:hypothetical protein [Rhizohabitans arisaemae]